MSKKFVIKASGQRVPFDPNKVIGTCIRAGASQKVAKRIAQKIYGQLKANTLTSEVYKNVLKTLSTEEDGLAIKHRYRLKESIMFMGPAGFAFEVYVAKILENYGFKIKSVGSLVDGKCVKHEIDIAANHEEDQKRFLVECKYHNTRGSFTRLKESLYTHARFLDLVDKFDSEMLVCNTKISDDAKTYSACVGQKILSWRYPQERGLEKMIEDKGLYPVTVFRLTRKELDALSQNDVMLARDLITNDLHQISKITKIPHPRLQRLQLIAKQIIS